MCIVFRWEFLISEFCEWDRNKCRREACRIHSGLDSKADKGESRKEEEEFECEAT